VPSPSNAANDADLAAGLLRWRENTGLSVEEAASRLKWTANRLTRVEGARWRVTLPELNEMAALYEVPDLEAGLLAERWASIPQWTVPSLVRKIATNPAYMGRRYHNGEDVGAAMWPKIVSVATFQAARLLLGDPARTTTRDMQVKHLLSGIARCSACEKALVGHNSTSRGYCAYRCYGHLSARKEPVDDYVVLAITKRMSQPDAAKLFGRRKEDDAEFERLDAELTRLRTELDEGEELVEAGKLSMARLARMEQRIQPRINAIEARLGAIRAHPVVGRLLQPIPADVLAEWQRMDIMQQREVLRTAVEVRIASPGPGRRNVPPEEYVTVTFKGRDDGQVTPDGSG
jgi:transcriptional regulator with XRE-family HTH domain